MKILYKSRNFYNCLQSLINLRNCNKMIFLVEIKDIKNNIFFLEIKFIFCTVDWFGLFKILVIFSVQFLICTIFQCFSESFLSSLMLN